MRMIIAAALFAAPPVFAQTMSNPGARVCIVLP